MRASPRRRWAAPTCRYCPSTGGDDSVLYEEWFHCTDLGTQLVPVIARFNASDAKATGVPAGCVRGDLSEHWMGG